MRSVRGQTLVASLIVIAIMCVLAVVLLRGSGAFGGAQSSRPDGKGTTVVGAVKYEAKDAVCKSNLGQVRQSLQILNTTDEEFPTTIQETKLPSEFYICPIGKEAYLYDPSTGKVGCPHPGHEKY